jgi:hypothetical protein
MRRSMPVVTLLVGSAMALAGLTAMTPLALSQAGPGEGGELQNDEDHDGVTNDRDQCSDRIVSQDRRVVQADGCPPFYALVGLRVDGIRGLLDKKTHFTAQCYYNRGVPCRIKGTLTLSNASRRKLGLKKARISRFDESFPTSLKESRYGEKTRHTDGLGLSKSVRAKLKKAKSVTITLSATYSRGGGAFKRVGSKTFTLTKTRLKGDKEGNGDTGVDNKPYCDGPRSVCGP